jgi:hypothetical protein
MSEAQMWLMTLLFTLAMLAAIAAYYVESL